MIKSEKGKVQLKGLGVEILEDYGVITYSLFEHLQKNIGEEAEEIIRCCFETGLETKKEEPQESLDVLDEIEKLLELIKEIKQHDRN